MRNRLSKTLPVAVALLLAFGGAAHAGVNAGATFAIDTPTEISGVGPGSPVAVTVSAAGLVTVKQLEIVFEVSPDGAFDLSGAQFAMGGGFASAVSPGVEFPQAGQVKCGGAFLGGTSVSGASVLGTLTLNTAAGFVAGTEATITVVKIGVGPSAATKDFFQPPVPALVVTVNPPVVAPTISGVAPGRGPTGGGTPVAISGSGFAAGATVTIGGAAATSVNVVSDTSITAVTPAGVAGAADVVVTSAEGESGTLVGGFVYVPPPRITGIVPAKGPTAGGTAVTITGSEFGNETTVAIGGAAATEVIVGSSTSITALTPAGTPGVAGVVVRNADGQSATLAAGFQYVAPPQVTGIAPASGRSGGGTAVTITGSGFAAGATVSIGGAAATGVVVVSATSITAVTPAGAVGPASVQVTNADGQSGSLAAGFSYVAVIEPALEAVSAVDATKDYSSVGTANVLDGSPGEATLAVRFTNNAGATAAGQTVSWTVTNFGSETVYRLSGGAASAIVPGGTLVVNGATAAGGLASITLDAEGTKVAGTTSVSVTAATATTNSEGAARNLSASYSVTWDVPVAAELSSFAGTYTPGTGVRLQWTSASQTGNLGWQVYRSTDNVTFVAVGDLVTGEGTVDSQRSYEFVDTNAPAAEVLYYYLNQLDLDGTSTPSQVIEVRTGVSVQALPKVTVLAQNYPNPFNPETTISFDLAKDAVVSLTVFDAAGRVVRTLVSGETYTAGRYTCAWNGRDGVGQKVASGVYLYQLQTGTATALRKMTLLQ